MTTKKETPKTEAMSNDEQVGFHKGALTTLAKERQELLKMVSIVEQLMQLHIKGLQELGVDLTKMAEMQQGQEGAQNQAGAAKKGPHKKIEDMLK